MRGSGTEAGRRAPQTRQEALASGLESCAGMRLLDLRCNRLGPGAARPLARALRNMPRLEYLEIGSNGLREIGSAALFQCLAGEDGPGGEGAVGGGVCGEDGMAGEGLSKVGEEDANVEEASREGALCLGDGRHAVGAFEPDFACRGSSGGGGGASGARGRWWYMGLRQNFIGDLGAQALVALPDVRLLRRLDLSGNALGNAGVGCVARALVPGKALEKLERLELYENAVGDEGALELAAGVVCEGLNGLICDACCGACVFMLVVARLSTLALSLLDSSLRAEFIMQTESHLPSAAVVLCFHTDFTRLVSSLGSCCGVPGVGAR